MSKNERTLDQLLEARERIEHLMRLLENNFKLKYRHVHYTSDILDAKWNQYKILTEIDEY